MRPNLSQNIAFVAGLVLIPALHTSGTLIHVKWMLPLAVAAALMAIGMRMSRRWIAAETAFEPPLGNERESNTTAVWILFGYTVLLLFSSMTNDRWFYFLDWQPDTESAIINVHSGIFQYAALSLLCLPLFLIRSRISTSLQFGLLAVWPLIALTAFLYTSGGQPFYNDDHPSFMYRLWIFGKSFPRLINYNPFWNAGNTEYSPMTTGALAPGILFWPFWNSGAVQSIYTWAVGVIYALFVPALALVSIRIMGLGWTPAFIAALLALGISRFNFIWWMHYGTIGANFTSAFVMPIAACLYRMFLLQRQNLAIGLVLVVSALFLMMWPPGAFMILPFIPALLVNIPAWSKTSIRSLIVCGLGFAIVYGYPLLALIDISDVATHGWIKPGQVTAHASDSNFSGWALVLEHFRQVHPLLLFLGIAGSLVVSEHHLRRWFLPILAGFILMVGWGNRLIPDIPFSRMAVPLFYVAVIPAAILTSRLFESTRRNVSVPQAFAFSLLLMTGWNASKLFAGEGEAGYHFISHAITKMAGRIQHQTPPDGRVWLAGPTSHYYEGGHVAFMPALFKREMLSSAYRHDQVIDIRNGSPPEFPPARMSDVYDYLNLFAVHSIITIDDDWLRCLRSEPGRFIETGSICGDGITYSLFTVQQPASLFLEGNGTIHADVNRLVVTLDSPNGTAVIKYLWDDHLKTPSEAELFPYDAGGGLRLIGIYPHGSRQVAIDYRRWI